MALNNLAKFNWDKILTKIDANDVKRTLNVLRARSNEVTNLATKYSVAPQEIDFSAYKSKLNFTAGAVDLLEKTYKNQKLPTYHATLPAFEIQKRQATLAVVQDVVDSLKNDMEEIQTQIEALKYTKISKDTTYEELADRFPEIAREIEHEISIHQWTNNPVVESKPHH